MSGYWSKSLCSKGGGSLWAQILGGMGCRPPTTVGVRKLVSVLSRGFVCVILRLVILIGMDGYPTQLSGSGRCSTNR